MAVQSEKERNKAVVDEFYKAGLQGHLTSFAQYLHPDFTIAAPNYLPWGGRHAGAAFFRDQVLPSLPDVFDFRTVQLRQRRRRGWPRRGDIQTIRDGKIARTYHVENWLSALGQLRVK